MSSLTNNNQPLCTNINLDNTIYKNTISRSVILDKIEYYLIYSHDTPRVFNLENTYAAVVDLPLLGPPNKLIIIIISPV